jgi:tetratricopeptide (TPR) repeat protein
VWEDLQTCVFDAPFVVVAVAQEGRGAAQARPWIEKARPSYPCLIDEEHRVSALYGMVNVPQCVWIDERGLIVRPAETAGSTDHFRRIDPVTRTLAPALAAEREAARRAYLDAVRAWIRTGKHALPGDSARARLPVISPDMAMADALFRLGLHLRRAGRDDEAAEHFAEASRLHPESWCMFRDAQALEPSGLAGGAAFWERVRALGDRPYYTPPVL